MISSIIFAFHHVIVSLFIAASMASSTPSGFDLQQAVAVINVLRQTGMWEAALQAANQPKSQGSMDGRVDTSTGSMHDGSKRRLFADHEVELDGDADEFDVISMVSGSGMKQGPITTATDGAKKEVSKQSLPPGVESLEMWGKTICTLPKVAGRRMTYVKLIHEADSNKETKDYLIWIVKNSHKSAKAEDFKAYMEAANCLPQEPATVNYPGTTAVREFGS